MAIIMTKEQALAILNDTEANKNMTKERIELLKLALRIVGSISVPQ